MFVEKEHKQQQNSTSSHWANPTLHTKQEIGAKDDPQEKEADVVTNSVKRKSESCSGISGAEGNIRRMHDEEKEKVMPIQDEAEKGHTMKDEAETKVHRMHDEEEATVMTMKDETVQPQSAKQVMKEADLGGGGGETATPAFQQQLNTTKGSGNPLPENIQRDFVLSTGNDLSNVKVHTDSRAHEMSAGINAKAFTHGNDIYFRQGQYNPATDSGKELIYHEAQHTVQQGGVRRKVQRKTQSGKTDLTADQVSFLIDNYGYKDENEIYQFESRTFLKRFINWWNEHESGPTSEQLNFLSEYEGIDLKKIEKSPGQLKNIRALLDELEQKTWVETLPGFGIWTNTVTDALGNSVYVLSDEQASFGFISFAFSSSVIPPVSYSGHFGFLPPGLNIAGPEILLSQQGTHLCTSIGYAVSATGKGAVKNRKLAGGYRHFQSSFLRSKANKQIWLTLNRDPAQGHVIGANASGDAVAVIQQALQFLYPENKINPSEISSSHWGTSTNSLLKKFQYQFDIDFGLEEGGRGAAAQKIEKESNYLSTALQFNAARKFTQTWGEPVLDADGIAGPFTLEALDYALSMREERLQNEQEEKELKAGDQAALDKNKNDWKNLKTWKSKHGGPAMPILPMPPMDRSNLRAHLIDPDKILYKREESALDWRLGTRWQVYYDGELIGAFTVNIAAHASDKDELGTAQELAQKYPYDLYPEVWKRALSIGVTNFQPKETGDTVFDNGLIGDIFTYGYSGHNTAPTSEEFAAMAIMDVASTPMNWGGGMPRWRGRLGIRSGMRSLVRNLRLRFPNLGAVKGGTNIVGSKYDLIKPTQDWINPAKVLEYKSLLQSGQKLDPIITYKNTRGIFIEDGHHRFAAYMELGMKPNMVLRNTGGPVGFPNWLNTVPKTSK